MNKKTIAKDDLEDVQQLCDSLKEAISEILGEQEISIGVSALYMAVIETLFEQTDNKKQLTFWLECFCKIFIVKYDSQP